MHRVSDGITQRLSGQVTYKRMATLTGVARVGLRVEGERGVGGGREGGKKGRLQGGVDWVSSHPPYGFESPTGTINAT